MKNKQKEWHHATKRLHFLTISKDKIKGFLPVHAAAY
jgi:hypothetical protein